MNNTITQSDAAPASDQSMGTVLSVSGEASLLCVLENLDLKRTTLRPGDPVYQQQVVETAPGASLTIRWDNGEIWTLGEQSSAELSPDMRAEGWQVAGSGFDTDGVNSDNVDSFLQSLEPTAAGPASGPQNDDGTGVVIIERGNEADPYQAFDTPGVDTDGVTPYQPAGLISEDIPLQPSAPADADPLISASYIGNYLPLTDSGSGSSLLFTEVVFTPIKSLSTGPGPTNYFFEVNLSEASDEPVSVDYAIKIYDLLDYLLPEEVSIDDALAALGDDLADNGVLDGDYSYQDAEVGEISYIYEAELSQGTLQFDPNDTTEYASGTMFAGKITPEFATIEFSDPQNALLDTGFVTVDLTGLA